MGEANREEREEEGTIIRVTRVCLNTCIIASLIVIN